LLAPIHPMRGYNCLDLADNSLISHIRPRGKLSYSPVMGVDSDFLDVEAVVDSRGLGDDLRQK